MNKKSHYKITNAIVFQLRKFHIFSRLLLMFCVLLIASTLFITLFNQRSYAREMETSSQKYLSMLVQNASFKLEQEAQRFEENILLLAQNEQVMSAAFENRSLGRLAELGDKTASQQYADNQTLVEHALLSAKADVDGIRMLLLVTEDIQYSTAGSAESLKNDAIRDLDAFHQSDIYKKTIAARGYPVWLDSTRETTALFYENETDNYGIIGCITLSYLVHQPGTRIPFGVLICCIYPQHLVNALSEYSGRDGGNTYIIGDKGFVEGIAAKFAGPPYLRQRSALLQRVLSQGEGTIAMEAEGRELLVNYSGSSEFPLYIVNLTYRDYALKGVNSLGRLNVMILLLVILVGIWGFYLSATSIAYPINKLIHTMKRVGAGDFSAVYRSEGHDEISVLCDEFNRMVSDMKILINRVYVSEIREKALQLNEKSAQLDALQTQISPHFLYNTLDMIRWECLYENSGESPASDMIEKFCTLLRMTIQGNQKKESVAKSLLHASTYLEVVNFRNMQKILLETQLSFDPSAYQLPCLALQPVLENAVRHGFVGEEKANRRICITGEVTLFGDLILRISDNGQGMTFSQLEAIRAGLAFDEITKASIGLRNVNQRCQLYYGENYGVQIESELERGTVVTLTIPAEPLPSAEEEPRV